MKSQQFKLSKIALSVAIITSSGLCVQAQAEDDVKIAEEIETISISGIRGSFIRSMDIKRESSGIVDAISAEEMGKFPDTNLAESLQRIPGITISRENGEGSEITARGFGPEFNLVTLNGRQIPGDGFSRSLSLDNLSSEGVQTIEATKTGRAEYATGGLGVTVNILTPRPLQQKERKILLMGKGFMDTSNKNGEDITPQYAALYSESFADETFGVFATYSVSRRDFRQESANIQGWQANVDLPSSVLQGNPNIVDGRTFEAGDDDKPVAVNGEPHWFPKDANYGFNDGKIRRDNGQLVLQYKPIENLLVTLDYTFSHAKYGRQTYGWGIWNNFGENINGYEIDSNGTVVYADISGDDGSFTASKGTFKSDIDSFGLNLDWNMTENLQFVFDYHTTKNQLTDGADSGSGQFGQVILGSDQLQNKIFDNRTGDIPSFYVNWNNGSNELAPTEIDSNFSQFFYRPAEADIDQAQLKINWLTPWELLPTIKFGLSSNEQTLQAKEYWSGLAGGPGFNPSYTGVFPSQMFVRNDVGDFLDQFSGSDGGINPNYYYTFDYDEAVARQLAGIPGYTNDLSNITPTQSLVKEETIGAYLQADIEFEVADMEVQLNMGVRYEETDVVSPSQGKIPTQVQWVSAGEWITVFNSDELVEIQNEGKYDVTLPMMDIKVNITDDLVGRFSWGQTIARAPLGKLLGGVTYTGSPKIGTRSAAGGNPNLTPFKSTNMDLSLEYYYGEDSYTSVAYFTKKVDDWITDGVTQVTVDGIYDVYQGQRYNEAVSQIQGRGEQATDSAIYAQMIANGHGDENGAISADPSSDPILNWRFSTSLNGEKREVSGIEFIVQHVFEDTGFGIAANATVVDGDVEVDKTVLETQEVLPGLSNSANFQIFYETDVLSTKLVYAWRDSYLIGQGQDQGSTSAEPAPPQFSKASGYLDFSINYDIDENLNVFFNAVNITDETEEGYGRYEEQFLFARQYGPKYAIGARYQF